MSTDAVAAPQDEPAPKAARPKATFDHLKRSTTRARTTVTLCMDGALQAEFEAADAHLREVSRASLREKPSFGDADPVMAAAEVVEAIRERMVESEFTFTLEAMSARKYSDLQAAHPPRKAEGDHPSPDEGLPFNQDTFVPALLSATVVELWAAAYRVNVRGTDVPFSALAYRTLHNTEQS
jgi:hypothetical protein